MKSKPLICSDVGKPTILTALLMKELDEVFEDKMLEHLRNCPECLTKMALCLSRFMFPDFDSHQYKTSNI